MMIKQMTIDDFLTNGEYKIKKQIRLIELFAGYGSQAMALKRLQNEGYCNFDHYKVVEFDKFAIASYNAVHNTKFDTIDIKNVHGEDIAIVNKDKYSYVLTYSFPCTDLSNAGKRCGMSKGSETRSGLLWEVERLLDEMDEQPDVLIMENVPQVIDTKNIKDFQRWIIKLESFGYSNFVKILNADDYGIPQKRKRCFMVSILGSYNYKFPKKFKSKNHVCDYLESSVEDKYYLTRSVGSNNDKINYVSQTERFINNTLKMGIKIPVEHGTYFCTVKNQGERNKFGKVKTQYLKKIGTKKANTLTTVNCTHVNTVGANIILEIDETTKLRKLTPRECGRLMGVTDEDITKMENVNSNTQLYKQFGNSIVVNVLYYIMLQLLEEEHSPLA